MVISLHRYTKKNTLTDMNTTCYTYRVLNGRKGRTYIYSDGHDTIEAAIEAVTGRDKDAWDEKFLSKKWWVQSRNLFDGLGWGLEVAGTERQIAEYRAQ